MHLPNSFDAAVADVVRRQTSNSNFNNDYNAARTGVRVISIGAIVGIVIGAIALLAMVVLCCCVVRRRRRSGRAGPDALYNNHHHNKNRFSHSTVGTHEAPPAYGNTPAYGPGYNGPAYGAPAGPPPAHVGGHHHNNY